MIHKIKHLVYKLRSSEHKLLEVVNNIDRYYYDKRQPKTKYGQPQKEHNTGEIRYRDLCVSTSILKGIQQRINSLLHQIDLPQYAYGSVKGSNNILNARQHISNNYFFSVDLKNFFPNITHHHVFRMFRQNDFSPQVSRILTQLTTYRGGLPQGAPSSPVIANLVFMETGLKLMNAIKGHPIIFTTYLDDLTFSSKKDFKKITGSLVEIIKAGGFYLHHKKIHYTEYKTEVTGIIINKNKLWPIKDMVDRAKTNPHVASYINSISYYM